MVGLDLVEVERDDELERLDEDELEDEPLLRALARAADLALIRLIALILVF